jgi:hypothetical protein
MSKTPRRLTARKLPAGQRSYEPWAKDARPDVEIHRDLLRQMAENRFAELPREIAAFLDGVAQSCVEVYWPARAKGARLTRQEVCSVVLSAVREGYLAALFDYSADIQEGDEAAVAHDERERGGDKGRLSQQKKKRDRLPEINAMIAAGKPVKQIAATLKVNPTTIYRALTPVKRRRKR